MNQLTTADIAALIQQDSKTLANWHYQLNTWGWPQEIPNPEPRVHHFNTRRGDIMAWIERAVGHKECLREHWKILDLETPDNKFDDFYEREFHAAVKPSPGGFPYEP